MKKVASGLAMFLALSCALQAAAMTIGVGLDWRKGVFVQEMWTSTMPQYQIFNSTDKAITVWVFPRSVAQDGTPKKRKELAGPWEIEARNSAIVDATPLLNKDFVQWELGDGTFLGLLQSPQKDAPRAPEKTIRSYNGVNGSGGQHRDIFTEQDKATFAPGETIELRLTLPANSGELKFFKKAEKDNTLAIQKLELADAQSDSLEISDDDKMVVVDSSKAKKTQASHVVTLHFKAPDVKTATLFFFDGWMQLTDGGGFSISRALVVEPAADCGCG